MQWSIFIFWYTINLFRYQSLHNYHPHHYFWLIIGSILDLIDTLWLVIIFIIYWKTIINQFSVNKIPTRDIFISRNNILWVEYFLSVIIELFTKPSTKIHQNASDGIPSGKVSVWSYKWIHFQSVSNLWQCNPEFLKYVANTCFEI